MTVCLDTGVFLQIFGPQAAVLRHPAGSVGWLLLKAQVLGFAEIKVDSERYDHEIVKETQITDLTRQKAQAENGCASSIQHSRATAA